MTPPTIFLPSLAEHGDGTPVPLPPDEARHLRALRMGPDERVRVTDGAGHCHLARIESDGGRDLFLNLEGSLATAPPLPVAIWFGVGSKDRMSLLVEKMVELGVADLRPIECARSRSVADAGRSDGFRDRLERRGIAALKQSGGAWLPRIRAIADLEEALGEPAGADERRFVADQRAGASPGELTRSVGRSSWLVGPEGGLTPDEREATIAAGFEPIHLGPRVLRFETAALVGATLLAAAHWSDWMEGSEE